ncbi:MAG: hypothetical protein ABFS42_11745 [Candidatus Krumholzibacteriota bacterium]
MTIRSKKNLFVILLAGALVFGLSSIALAQNTPSGTPINNTATLDFSVSGTPQTQVVSNIASFLVDNKVDLTVTTVDAAIVAVIPGGLAQVLTYAVTNNGNTVQDYSLSALNSPTGAFGEVETFNAVNVNVYVDTDADNTYTAADTDTYIDELASGASITVFVLSDIPLVQVNNDVASYDLIAQTAAGGTGGAQGADILADDAAAADDPALIQIVFGDGAGTADGATDGRFSSKDGYKVITTTLTAMKTTSVISDPFNLAVNPKAIPGATVGYTILVTNSGTLAADNVEVIDSVPANSAFLVGSVATVPAAVVSYSNDGGATWAYGPVPGANGTDPAVTDVRVVYLTVAAASAATETFSVIID